MPRQLHGHPPQPKDDRVYIGTYKIKGKINTLISEWGPKLSLSKFGLKNLFDSKKNTDPAGPSEFYVGSFGGWADEKTIVSQIQVILFFQIGPKFYKI